MYMLAGFATLLVGLYLVFKLGKDDDLQAAVRTGDPT
jgi:hypothetical protein